MKKTDLRELASLFFTTRQMIRANLPQGQADPNAWMRCETLRFIDEHGRPTMREVAAHLRITAPSATSLIRKLQRLGWTLRKPSGSDRRVVRISLTPTGKRELSRYRTRAEVTMRRVFSKLPERDLSHLIRVLRTLNDVHHS
ncbi:MAG TPA: MarR family transcriptional regulator [Candidatus Paceibacterota bacterium]|jgi:DNA-binding MarR family transcriptional regulator|nr:MarR family transcriptional regulator [Candidatus Paceibacterota bacterium]